MCYKLLLVFVGRVIIVFFGWVLFRADTLPDAIMYITSMFGLANNDLLCDTFLMYLSEKRIFLIASVIFSVSIAPYVSKKLKAAYGKKNALRALPLVCDVIYPVIYAGMFLFSVTFLLKGTYNPFIYFNF